MKSEVGGYPMLKNITVAVMLAALFTAGCGAPSKKNPVSKQVPYPESRYLTAEGSGQTEMEARRHALAELSGIFESKVHSETTSLARSAIGLDNTEQFEKNVESKIDIISSVQLKGAKTVKVWQSENSDLFRALAVIDRMQAGRDWSAELETIEAQAEAQMKTLDNTQGRFRRMVLLNRTFSLLLKKQALESRLRVINYPSRSSLDVDIRKITTELAQLRSQLRLFVEFSGDRSQVAEDRVSGALTESGFLLGDTRNAADALIIGKIGTQLLELNNPKIKFVRATATVKVIETGTGSTFANLNENVRKGHVDQEEAARRAVIQLSEILSEKLVSAIGFGTDIAAD
jgi:hypothetical protein